MIIIGENEEPQALCPTCNATIPLDAAECPSCGELFAEEAAESAVSEATVAEAAPPEAITPEEVEEVVTAGKREKILFYMSIVLILLGGPGIAMGSWLHDILRIPLIGETYEAFGWINKMFASAGLLILIVGIILLILSLRRTTVVVEEYDLSFEGKEEGEENAKK